jgi:hypothetical protein
MTKAHPNILIQLCERLGLKADKIPCLYEYVTKPEVMDKIMVDLGYAKDPVKKMILAVINGGQKDYKDMNAEKSEWMRRFKAEIELIDSLFLARYPERWEEHKVFRRKREKLKSKRVHVETDEGSFVNMFLLESEAAMLDTIKRELKKRRLMGKRGDDFVCCADGGMLPKDERVNDALLHELGALITRDTGFVMKLTFKAMSVLDLPEDLPMPKKMPEMLKYLDPRIWDQFSRLGPGMPVIACETVKDRSYQNNHRYVITAVNETFVTLRSVMKETETPHVISVEKSAFRRDFQPAYCITSHKAQGATFRELHGVHELHMMGAAGGYVALTRTDDPAKVVIFKEAAKNQAFLDYLKEVDAHEAAKTVVVEEDSDSDDMYDQVSDAEHMEYLASKYGN